MGKKFLKYYVTGTYKGFRKIHSYSNKSNITTMVFSDGNRKIFGFGKFSEEALTKIFKQIDHFSRSKGMPEHKF